MKMLKYNNKIFSTFADNTNPSSTSAVVRKKRFAMFLDSLDVNENTKILDVG
jgi:hypothetical protein